MHYCFVSFFVCLQPKKILSLSRALIFLLHFGTPMSKTGGELLYYYLYHEEASFYLDILTQLFGRNFINF